MGFGLAATGVVLATGVGLVSGTTRKCRYDGIRAAEQKNSMRASSSILPQLLTCFLAALQLTQSVGTSLADKHPSATQISARPWQHGQLYVNPDGSVETPAGTLYRDGHWDIAAHSGSRLVRAHGVPTHEPHGRHQGLGEQPSLQMVSGIEQAEAQLVHGGRDPHDLLKKLQGKVVLGPLRKDLWPPPSVAMLIGAVTSAVIIVVILRLSVILARPMPWADTRLKLQAAIEEQRERTLQLEKALHRQEEERDRDQQAAGEENNVAEEIAAPEPTQSYDELVGEVLYRTREPERVLAELAGQGLRQAAPLVGRAAHTVATVQERIKETRAKAENLVAEEASKLMESVQDALGTGSDLSGFPAFLQGGDGAAFGDAEQGTIGLMLHGLLAPAFLRAMMSSAQVGLMWHVIMLALSIGVLATDWTKHCTDWMVWTWMIGCTLVHAIQCVCNGVLQARCAQALIVVRDAQLSWEASVNNTGNPIWDAYVGMKTGGDFYFIALCRYEAIQNSTEYATTKLLSLITMKLGVLGLYLTCANIISDVVHCDANLILFFMHVSAFLFVLLFFFHVLALALWLLQRLSGCAFVHMPILKLAKKMDKDVPFQIPLYALLVRTFLLRNSSDIIQIKADSLAHDVKLLEAEKKAAHESVQASEAKLAKRRAEMVRTFEEHIQARNEEDAMIQKYRESIGLRGGSVDISAESARRVVAASTTSAAAATEVT